MEALEVYIWQTLAPQINHPHTRSFRPNSFNKKTEEIQPSKPHKAAMLQNVERFWAVCATLVVLTLLKEFTKTIKTTLKA